MIYRKSLRLWVGLCVTIHWRIYNQNFPAHAPPTAPNSFVFTYIFAKIPASEIHVPPKRVHAPYGKSWIRPCNLINLNGHTWKQYRFTLHGLRGLTSPQVFLRMKNSANQLSIHTTRRLREEFQSDKFHQTRKP